MMETSVKEENLKEKKDKAHEFNHLSSALIL